MDKLQPQSVDIDKLTPDYNNARAHDENNLNAIVGSLKMFGQRKPIVIDQSGTIVAGNGTVEAAKRLGWKQIQAVSVPADWDEDKIKAFALADNRTAELAKWNNQVLAEQLLELSEKNWKIEDFGFVQEQPKPDLETEEFEWSERYEVVIECDDELHQGKLIERFQKEGMKVRAIVI